MRYLPGMFKWPQLILSFCLAIFASPLSASIPQPVGFKTQEQIQAGLEILTASSAQTHVHNQANQILDVYHNTPGMTVTPIFDANGNLTEVVHTVEIEAGPPLVFTSTYEYDVDNRLIAVILIGLGDYGTVFACTGWGQSGDWRSRRHQRRLPC